MYNKSRNKGKGNARRSVKMINKDTYKRITARLANGKAVVDFIASGAGRIKTVDRLAELEDKIMDGTLVEQNEWISVKDKLPNYDEKVLVYVPKRDGCSQNGIFTADYKPIKADDGSGNFWRVPTKACEWTVWSWSYFEHPVVTHWIPFPIPPTKAEAEAKLKELQEKEE